MEYRLTVIVVMLVVLTVNHVISEKDIPDIAVIGAGIGGASTCHMLRTLFGETGANIAIFEASKVGGRLAVAKIAGHVYDVGGSFLVPENNYMQEFAKILELKKRKIPKGRLGLYNGKDYVYSESNWKLATLLKLFWHYGKDAYRLQWKLGEILENFGRIYALQNQGYTFSSVSQLLSAMDPIFVNMTQMTGRRFLQEQGFSDKFINEVFMGIARGDFGQTADMNAFAGILSLAAIPMDVWAIYGGNRLVPEKIVETSKVDFISGVVKEVSLKDEKFLLKYTKNSPNLASSLESAQNEKTYDLVIVATPLIKDISNITFNNFPNPIKNFEGSYHHTVCTLVHGKINHTYFNMDTELDEVLTTSTDVPFNSLTRLYPVDVKPDHSSLSNVWKVFSQKPLTDSQLDSMFVSRDEIHITDWVAAYPHYTPPDKLGPFVLYPGLYYTSSIEWAASAMEMSSIAGKNAALLAFNHWHGVEGKLDMLQPVNIKTEL